MALLAVVTIHFIEDFDKHRQHGIEFCLADDIRFLIYVEEDAFRGNDAGLFQVCQQ